MTLNTSGPISLGGSTTGQSIALELNQSATGVISLNDANVRQLAGVPSGTIIVPTNFYGKSAGPVYGVQQAVIQGSPYNGNPTQGGALAVSADGNTLVLGGPSNTFSQQGQFWIFTRSGSIWTQQAGPLIGSGVAVNAALGRGVAISDDGNTVAVGARGQGLTGAVWIWTRSGTTWSQQAGPLVGPGSGTTGNQFQGRVALSSDGNTLAVGGSGFTNPATNAQTGAIWIWTRSGGTWSLQAGPLFDQSRPTESNGLGQAVAISADGNTVAGGGSSSADGGVWVWTRSGSTWTQQGGRILGSGSVYGGFGQGGVVTLSSDGNTMAFSSVSDNAYVGATWVFTRSGSTWTQQGSKLVGTGLVTAQSAQGSSLSLSGDGNKLAIGAQRDNAIAGTNQTVGKGAVWVFSRSGSTWSQSQKIINPDQASSVWFGQSVSLSRNDGRTLLVGNPGPGANWPENPIGYAVAYTQTN